MIGWNLSKMCESEREVEKSLAHSLASCIAKADCTACTTSFPSTPTLLCTIHLLRVSLIISTVWLIHLSASDVIFTISFQKMLKNFNRILPRALVRSKHTLPSLTYDFGDLEPIMSATTLETHYAKHHQTYVNNLNQLAEKLDETKDEATRVSLMQPYSFNAGGHVNHTIFWSNLKPVREGGGEISGQSDLLKAIESEYGSFDGFVGKFNAMTVGVQGSGWGWLGYNKGQKRLEMTTTANQDVLVATKGLVPLLGVDVWEHAYYLDYKNVRADFLKNIWKIVNWENVAERYKAAQQ